MDINTVLKTTANALVKENSQTEIKEGAKGVSIVPKYLKSELITADIKFSDYKLLMLIYEYTNTVTGMCYPSQEKLADDLSKGQKGKVDPGTISKSLKKLERHGFLHCLPTRIYLDGGKFEVKSSFIILTPFAKIEDAQYHKEMTDMINTMKYAVIDHDKDGQRIIVGSGVKSNSKTQPEINAYTEEKRQQAIQTIKVVETVVEPKVVKAPEPKVVSKVFSRSEANYQLQEMVRRLGGTFQDEQWAQHTLGHIAEQLNKLPQHIIEQMEEYLKENRFEDTSSIVNYFFKINGIS